MKPCVGFEAWGEEYRAQGSRDDIVNFYVDLQWLRGRVKVRVQEREQEVGLGQ